MRPAHNAVALIATLLAAAGLLPLPAQVRFTLLGLAVALLLLLLVLRLRAHGVRRGDARISGTFERIERIRRARETRRTRH
jgi:hypothetical protein